jgi:pentatricopeptide repeat protein
MDCVAPLTGGKESWKKLFLPMRRPGQPGNRLKTRTLGTVISALCPSPSLDLATNQMERKLSSWSTIMSRIEASHLANPSPSPSTTSHSSNSSLSPPSLSQQTRLAILLLRKARSSRHRRTSDMYSRLINACLLQGEIITGTLLFVLLVKDWQVREVVKAARERYVDEAHVEDYGVGRRSERLRRERSGKTKGLPTLGQASSLGLDLSDTELPLPRPSVLMLHRILKELRFSPDPEPPDLASAKALKNIVLLLRDKALPFGDVGMLLKVMYGVPKRPALALDGDVDVKGKVKEEPQPKRLYDLCHSTLLSLLTSPPSSTPSPTLSRPHILPPLSHKSQNALLHYALRHRLSPFLASDLLRNMTPDTNSLNIVLRAGTILRRDDIVRHALESFDWGSVGVEERVLRGILATLDEKSIVENVLNSPSTSHPHILSTTLSRISTEPFTLSSLSAPKPVPNVYTFSTLLTHLISSGHPHLVLSLLSVLPSSPYIYTSLLNALIKMGQIRLAEKVWKLAKKAERGSWDEVQGRWCLGIEAYTVMMQGYALENRKSSLRRPERGERARKLGLEVHRSMMESGRRIWDEMVDVLREVKMSGDVELFRRMGKGGELPIPDGRFYNAVLELYGRDEGILWEVEREMGSVGLEMPYGFRRVGGVTVGKRMGEVVGVRPWAYPDGVGGGTPYRVLVRKERGLPLRRSGGRDPRRRPVRKEC